MGSCLSKKNACSSSSVSHPKPPENPKPETQSEEKKTEEEIAVKKEIFIIKHRKSNEIERQQRSSDEEKCESEKADAEKGRNVIDGNGVGGGTPLPAWTSSCTKEEVDAILIHCGRLSRSSSIEKAAALPSENGGRRYSGSKRSYDFDGEGRDGVIDGDDDAAARERDNRQRERRRQSQGRRRTPSREREQQRSGSKERGGVSGGRRVSRSPGRRSESPNTAANSNSNSNSNSSAAVNGKSRPGKMVSVPATDKSNNAAGGGGEVKRIHVKRNVGGSPRARSPASQQQPLPLSLSRSNSRKAEHSPYRRNPLAEIDTNIIQQKPNADNNKTIQVSENKNNHHHHHDPHQETHGLQTHVALNVISSGSENPKNHQLLTRTRSSRLSRDLDINPETLSNPNTTSSSSYTALLLEDIQNFHQKNTSPPAFTLPPCVTKACSILEAVADLNSSTEQTNKIKKTKPDIINKDPIVESEVLANDDLVEPSFHKYVTVRRGASEEDREEQESSGSNSFVTGSGQHWGSSSNWEPDSAESTDRWMSSESFSRSVTTRQAMSESGRIVVVDESGKKVSSAKKKRESSDLQRNGIGRGRVGTRSSNTAGNATISI